MDDLRAVFRQLKRPEAGGGSGVAFNSLPIQGRRQWHVAKGTAGCPAILVESDPDAAGDRPLAVSLQNLRVEHGVRCRLTRPDGSTEMGRYTIIECLAADSEVQDCFLRAVGGGLMGVQGDITANEVTNLVDRLVVLCQLARQPREGTFRGLWAELFAILVASDPAIMVEAWHSLTTEHFDFSRGEERLEVKSSSGRSRDHAFSFEQVYPPSSVSVLVASVYVESQTNGRSLGFLWDRVVDATPSADARLKVERVCVQSLGEDIREGRAFSGDWDLAVDSLAFYRITDIPRPPSDCPPGVSQVRFRSDLSLADPVQSTPVGLFHRCCMGVVNLT